jgi:hypothetical protein
VNQTFPLAAGTGCLVNFNNYQWWTAFTYNPNQGYYYNGGLGTTFAPEHEAVSRKVPRTTANDNEADLRVSITRFYSTRCSEAKLRREGDRRSEGNRLRMTSACQGLLQKSNPVSFSSAHTFQTHANRPFQLHKRRQLFIRTHNETLSLVPVCSDRKLKLI